MDSDKIAADRGAVVECQNIELIADHAAAERLIFFCNQVAQRLAAEARDVVGNGIRKIGGDRAGPRRERKDMQVCQRRLFDQLYVA